MKNIEKFKIPAIAGAIALFTIIISVIFADIFYQPKKMAKRGFQIELSLDGTVIKKEEKPVDFESLLKIADAAKGAKISKKCASCHSLGKGEAAKIGPNLFSVVGRKRAAMQGFKYSEAMSKKGGAWNAGDLNLFLTKPKDYIPGTKMSFAGLSKPQDRADLILFLQKNR